MSFGEQLKQLREVYNLKQEDIAKVLNVSRPTVSDFERGHSMPNPEYLLILSKHFNVSIDFLLCNPVNNPTYSVTKIQHLYGKLNHDNKIRAIERLQALYDMQTKTRRTPPRRVNVDCES